MKYILKVADLRKISKATGLDLDELKNGAYWLNRGDSARSCFIRSEYEAIALYLVTREVNDADRGGEVSGARPTVVMSTASSASTIARPSAL